MALKLLINSLFRGGAEKQLAALAGSLPHDGLLLLEDEVDLPVPGPAPVPLSGHGASTSSLLKTACIPLYARRLAALTGPGDTVLSFMERANIVNVAAAAISGHRAVICERTRPSGEFSGLRGALMRPLIRRYYPRAALVVANSEGVRADLEKNFGVPPGGIKVIYNGYDLAGIRAAAARPLPQGWDAVLARPTVVTSGRLTAAKGHWHLLKIFSLVKKQVPGAALVLLGDGELAGRLSALAAGLGLRVCFGAPAPDADVYFAGYVGNPYAFLARARLFAFTSLWEGFPNALAEALICGTPVFSSDCSSGPREILAPGSQAGEAGAYGVLLPVLSGAWRPAGAPPEPAELAWAAELSAALGDQAALRGYAASGLVRAADFGMDKSLASWTEALTT